MVKLWSSYGVLPLGPIARQPSGVRVGTRSGVPFDVSFVCFALSKTVERRGPSEELQQGKATTQRTRV